MQTRITHPATKAGRGHAFQNALIAGVCSLVACGAAGAGVIATNADVPSDMDAGGTLADPAVYVLDSYTPASAWTTFRVGQTTSYNELQVINGSALSYSQTNQWWIGKVVGASATATHNRVLVSGAGSSLDLTGSGSQMYVGYEGDSNSVLIENGASFSAGFSVYVGAHADGMSNSFTVDNATATMGSVYVGDAGNDNSLVVRGGGSLDASITDIGEGGSGNNLTVSGAGSIVMASSGYGAGSIGSSTYANNTLTVEDGGLYMLDTLRNNSSELIAFGSASGNVLQLAAGFVAISGNRVGTGSDLDDANIVVWDGAAWQAAVRDSNYTATYYADDAAGLLGTGIDGLGGYTVYTGGENIPEPASLALLAAGAVLLASRHRRHV